MRVVNPSDTAMQVQVGQGASFALSAQATVASPFQVVDSRQPLQVTVNGREIKGLSAPKSAWVTLILDSDPARAPRLVIDPPLRGKDLRAELNIYNLANGCEKAGVQLANRAPVFNQVPFNGQAQRTINPVQATLVANCEQNNSLPFKLAPFKAGDRYSLFLIGSRPGATPDWPCRPDRAMSLQSKSRLPVPSHDRRFAVEPVRRTTFKRPRR